MIRFKIDIIRALADVGINSYTCKVTGKPFAQGTLTRLKNNQGITLDTVDKLCKALDCNIEDILEYVPDPYISD